MITSMGNSQMKNIVQLNTKGKARKEQGVFVTEGLKMFLEAPEDRIEKVYVSENFFQKTQYKDQIEKYPHEIVAQEVFQKISDTMTPQGILCVVRQSSYSLEDLLRKEKLTLLLLESIQDPGNLGTMIRTGEGAGVDGIVMDSGTVDIYNPKVIRATMGSVYRMPFLYTTDLKQTILEVQKAGVKLFAAHLKGEKMHWEASLGKRTGFLIGNEGNGLSDEIAGCADEYIKIPMEGEVESLNAAVAASLLMYEAKRQRDQNECMR